MCRFRKSVSPGVHSLNTVSGKPPKPGRLSRRKSLSDNCLGQIKKKNDVDAFGLPRISTQNKRSVSLMRDAFTSRKEDKSEGAASDDYEGRIRSISKETRTSNASEFKAKFESGSVSNLSKVSRNGSFYKPPKVDKAHLNKVMNKFNDKGDGVKLPFPNYRPPIPSCKPPPPPPL